MNENKLSHDEMVRKLAVPGDVILQKLTLNHLGLLTHARNIYFLASDLMRYVTDQFSLVDERGAFLNHCAIRVAGEAGEVLDLIKKFAFNGIDLDKAKMIKEIGDIDFYLVAYEQRNLGCLRAAELRDTLTLLVDHFALTWAEIKAVNYNKLLSRYPNFEYSDEAARNRADVQK